MTFAFHYIVYSICEVINLEMQLKEFEKYKTEAEEKWGDTDAYKQHIEKTKNYSKLPRIIIFVPMKF